MKSNKNNFFEKFVNEGYKSLEDEINEIKNILDEIDSFDKRKVNEDLTFQYADRPTSTSPIVEIDYEDNGILYRFGFNIKEDEEVSLSELISNIEVAKKGIKATIEGASDISSLDLKREIELLKKLEQFAKQSKKDNNNFVMLKSNMNHPNQDWYDKENKAMNDLWDSQKNQEDFDSYKYQGLSESNDNEEDIISNWGGYGDEEEEFSPEEFFGAAGDAAEADIMNDPEWGGKYGFTSFGSTEDPRMLKKLIKKESYIKKLRSTIQEIIKESYSDLQKESNENIDEERIANTKAKKEIDNLDNFIGSHIYGEDLGGLGEMYVAYSYGEQFPVYVHYKGKWYHNTDYYMLDDDKINKPTEKHKKVMKPSGKTHPMSLKGLQSMIQKFKNKNNIGDNNHKDVEPGEKN